MNQVLNNYNFPRVRPSPKQRYHRRLKLHLITPTREKPSFTLISRCATSNKAYSYFSADRNHPSLQASSRSSGISACDLLWCAWIWVSWQLHIYHHFRRPLSPPSISDTSQRPSQKKNPFQSWVKIKQWMRRAGPAENGNCPATCNISHEEVTPRPPLNIPIIFLLRTKSTRCWVGLNWYLFILIRHYSHISRTSWIYVLYSSTCHHMHTLPWGISLNNPLLWNNQ